MRTWRASGTPQLCLDRSVGRGGASLSGVEGRPAPSARRMDGERAHREHAPSGYPSVPAGVLDRDTAWTAFLVHRLGLPDGRPDAVSLLRWTLDPQQAPRFESLESTARQGVRDRLIETAGAVGGAVADCLEARTAQWRFRLAWRWASSLPMTSVRRKPLRCGRLQSDSSGPERESRLRQTWRRNGKQLRRVVLRETTDTRVRHDAMTRADAILEQLGVAAFAYPSDWSPAGFQQRLVRLAATLRDALDRGPPHDVWVSVASSEPSSSRSGPR